MKYKTFIIINMDAILGYTGLVGSTIRESLDPSTTKYFNRSNFHSVKDYDFKTVYGACIPGVKWWANKYPEEDLSNINSIIDSIKDISCEKFVLISTIDVHDMSRQVQSEKVESPAKHAYGENRFYVEKKLFQIFGDKLFIVRLPALFGVGLKKNLLYDLMNNNRVKFINANSCYQWYPLSLLVQDIDRFLDLPVKVLNSTRKILNLYPCPIETMEIVRTFFPEYSTKVLFGKRQVYNQELLQLDY